MTDQPSKKALAAGEEILDPDSGALYKPKGYLLARIIDHHFAPVRQEAEDALLELGAVLGERDALRSKLGDIQEHAHAMDNERRGALRDRDALRDEVEEANAELERRQAKVMKLRAEVAERNAWLAECFRLSGADPDGNEDWRLAPSAVAEVRELRDEYDQVCDELQRLRAVVEAARESVKKWPASRELCAALAELDKDS